MSDRHRVGATPALGYGPSRCVIDRQPWPCDTATETARADKAEAALGRCRDEFTRQNDCDHSECIDRYDAAIQQRDALADAIRGRLVKHPPTKYVPDACLVTHEEWDHFDNEPCLDCDALYAIKEDEE